METLSSQITVLFLLQKLLSQRPSSCCLFRPRPPPPPSSAQDTPRCPPPARSVCLLDAPHLSEPRLQALPQPGLSPRSGDATARWGPWALHCEHPGMTGSTRGPGLLWRPHKFRAATRRPEAGCSVLSGLTSSRRAPPGPSPAARLRPAGAHVSGPCGSADPRPPALPRKVGRRRRRKTMKGEGRNGCVSVYRVILTRAPPF